MSEKNKEVLEEEKEQGISENPDKETECETNDGAGAQDLDGDGTGNTEETPDAEGEAETSEAGADAADAGKKGFFKKKKDKKDEQIEELNDKLKRQMAEFDNFRKRSEKEKSQMYDMGAKSIVEKILPVIDNFERGLAGVPEEEKDNAFVVGMDKVYRQMLTELETVGVKPIEAIGEEFNPEYHNAVMQTESEEYESGTVAQELQKGYMYKESVVRHSMVAVVS